MIERAKHILWRAHLQATDIRNRDLLRLMLALASYEHRVWVVFYDQGLSLLAPDIDNDIAGMIAAFKLYDIQGIIVTDNLTHDYANNFTVIDNLSWQSYLSAAQAAQQQELSLPPLTLSTGEVGIDWMI